MPIETKIVCSGQLRERLKSGSGPIVLKSASHDGRAAFDLGNGALLQFGLSGDAADPTLEVRAHYLESGGRGAGFGSTGLAYVQGAEVIVEQPLGTIVRRGPCSIAAPVMAAVSPIHPHVAVVDTAVVRIIDYRTDRQVAEFPVANSFTKYAYDGFWFTEQGDLVVSKYAAQIVYRPAADGTYGLHLSMSTFGSAPYCCHRLLWSPATRRWCSLMMCTQLVRVSDTGERIGAGWEIDDERIKKGTIWDLASADPSFNVVYLGGGSGRLWRCDIERRRYREVGKVDFEVTGLAMLSERHLLAFGKGGQFTLLRIDVSGNADDEPSEPAPTTTVRVTYKPAAGQQLFIRGEGPGLDWQRGQRMEFSPPDRWTWTTKAACRSFPFKPLINDVAWSVGENLTARLGEESAASPQFDPLPVGTTPAAPAAAAKEAPVPEMLEFAPLWELCDPELYRSNAFRLMELPVTATERDVVRRREWMEKAARNKLPMPPGPARVLPRIPAPAEHELRECAHAIQDLQRRLLHEFFWFWPLDESADPRGDEALRLLTRGEVAGARRAWEAAAGETASGSAARHNLAVYQLVRAMDAEYALLEQPERVTAAQAEQAEAAWAEAFKIWPALLAEQPLWTRVAARVRAFDDASLPGGVVRRLEASLPTGLLLLNARLALHHISAHRQEQARRLAAWVQRGDLFSEDARQAALRIALEPLRRQLKHRCEAAEKDAERDFRRGREIGERLIETGTTDLPGLELLLGADHPTVGVERDRLALAALQCLIFYANKTEDWEKAATTMETIRPIAVGTEAKEKLERNITIMRGNAAESNGWRGPGYWDCPAEAVAEMEEAHTAMEAGDNGKAVRTASCWIARCLSGEVDARHRPVFERSLAYALNSKAVREDRAAWAAYKEDPPALAKVTTKVLNAADFQLRDSIPELVNRSAQFSFLNTLKCLSCGSRIYSSYFTRRVTGLRYDAAFCPTCNDEIRRQVQEQQRVRDAALEGLCELLLLATELNGTSRQLRSNLEAFREQAVKLSLNNPTSSMPLRRKLGIVPFETLLPFMMAGDTMAEQRRTWELMERNFPVKAREFRATFTAQANQIVERLSQPVPDEASRGQHDLEQLHVNAGEWVAEVLLREAVAERCGQLRHQIAGAALLNTNRTSPDLAPQEKLLTEMVPILNRLASALADGPGDTLPCALALADHLVAVSTGIGDDAEIRLAVVRLLQKGRAGLERFAEAARRLQEEADRIRTFMARSSSPPLMESLESLLRTARARFDRERPRDLETLDAILPEMGLLLAELAKCWQGLDQSELIRAGRMMGETVISAVSVDGEFGRRMEKWTVIVAFLQRLIAAAPDALVALREELAKELERAQARAQESNGWAGEAYWQLPATAVARLEAIREEYAGGRFDACIAQLVEILKAGGEAAITAVTERCLACGLHAKAAEALRGETSRGAAEEAYGRAALAAELNPQSAQIAAIFAALADGFESSQAEVDQILREAISKTTGSHKSTLEGALRGSGADWYSAGVMFFRGEGVAKDERIGLFLLKGAARNGHALAAQFLKNRADTATGGGALSSSGDRAVAAFRTRIAIGLATADQCRKAAMGDDPRLRQLARERLQNSFPAVLAEIERQETRTAVLKVAAIGLAFAAVAAIVVLW